jgi:hypothetical protein
MRSLKVLAVVGLAVSTLAGYALGEPTLVYNGREIFEDVPYIKYKAIDNAHGIWEVTSYKVVSESPLRVGKEEIMFEQQPDRNTKPVSTIRGVCYPNKEVKEILFYIREDVVINRDHDHYIQIEGCDNDKAAFKLPRSGDPSKPLAALLPPVPSATEWGLIVLGLLLAGSLAFMIRRRLAPRPAGA